MMINNKALLPFIRNHYTMDEFLQLKTLLEAKSVFQMTPFHTGLFAAVNNEQMHETGYRAVWIRDNIHVAHAYYVCGHHDIAIKNWMALSDFMWSQRFKMEAIIDQPSLANQPMNRPHVRFDGETLAEINEKWSHAQNDALGYFLWLSGKMVKDAAFLPREQDKTVVQLMIQYLEAIRYWEDEDSGHWEEVRKISASSIGVVVAALRQLQALDLFDWPISEKMGHLYQQGLAFLETTLPLECQQHDLNKFRTVDSALLFLIYPLELLDDNIAELIIRNVKTHLMREHGIKRYLGDSFYCRDYEKNMNANELTRDFSDDIDGRDDLLTPGGEAQWSIFDPILSMIYGKHFLRSRDPIHLDLQIKHWNRALGFITGDHARHGTFLCPELYYEENGQWQTSRSTPLKWNQANLWIATQQVECSLRNELDQ